MDHRCLSFDEHEVRVLRVLEDETLGRAGDEVGDHRIDGDAAALDEDARLPVAANAVRIPLARSASRICSCVVILPMLQWCRR